MFYVYENWTHKRGRAHIAECSHCNSGKGTQAAHSGRNDTWHGPFQTREAAEQSLARLKRRG